MIKFFDGSEQNLTQDDSVVTFGATDDTLSTHLDEGSLRICGQVPALRPSMLGLFGMGEHWSQPGGVFAIWVTPRGGLVLRHRTHDTSLSWEGPAEFCGMGDELRISYLIWTSLGRGLLRAENATTGATCEARFTDAQALPLFAGWTDLPELPTVQVARVPLTPRGAVGFAHGTHLPTPNGPVPVQDLNPGDMLQGVEGPVRIRSIDAQTMTDVQRQEAITLNAPYFGLTEAITVLPDQRIRVSTRDVFQVTGHTQVLSAARDLVVAHAAHPDWQGRGPMFSLAFDQPATLMFGHCQVVCPGSAEPSQQGTILPAPGDDPWATRTETVNILDAVARRDGVLPDEAANG